MSIESFSEFEKPDQKSEEKKLKSENKSENQENSEERERILNPEEIETLGREMNEYAQGLKNRIEEIKAELETGPSEDKAMELQAEMEELQIQYDGLTEMTENINTENFENITEKPVKE